MPEINDAPDNEIKRRFSVESAERWRLLLRHFSWSDEFAFIVLLAPGQEASEICARELETFFQESGKRLVKMIPKTPDDLVALIFPLVTFEPDPSVGALWVSAVVSESDPEHPAWLRAWRELAARLNERRDVLRFRVKIPLIFVGMEWLKPMLREIAPDLWSVRTLVIEMKWRPLAATGEMPESIQLDSLVDESNLDPEFALAEAEKVRRRGGDEAMLARLLNRAGTAFRERGEFQRAELALREALEIRERLYGDTHPDTATSLSGLAQLYWVQSAYAKALPLEEKALAIREKTLGTEHLETAQSLNNLAALHSMRKEYDKAVSLAERALAIREKALGMEHPETVTTLSNLAYFHLSQKAYAKALPLAEQALAIREKTLGANHPDTAKALERLALVYWVDNGRDPAKILPMLERALAIQEKAFGVEDPNTKNVAANLAKVREYLAVPPAHRETNRH